MITIENLSKKYGSQIVLNIESLNIPRVKVSDWWVITGQVKQHYLVCC